MRAVTDWRLVGRSEEVELLTAILRADAPGVVLSGAAGVGKTRLAAELVGRAARLGHRTGWTLGVRSVRATPAAGSVTP